MQNRFIYIIILAFAFVNGCMFFEKKIDDLYPNGIELTFETFKKCERLIVDKNYFILQVNANYGTDRYDPYLLFYRKDDLLLEFKVYNPGKVFSVKNNLVCGFYNENRSHATKTKLENNYTFLFDKKEPQSSRNIFGGTLSSFKVDGQYLFLKLKDRSTYVKYHINEIVFSPFDKNNIEIYHFYTDALTYTYYALDELELKKSIWEKFILKM